jgi:hypothetical protein
MRLGTPGHRRQRKRRDIHRQLKSIAVGVDEATPKVLSAGERHGMYQDVETTECFGCTVDRCGHLCIILHIQWEDRCWIWKRVSELLDLSLHTFVLKSERTPRTMRCELLGDRPRNAPAIRDAHDKCKLAIQ